MKIDIELNTKIVCHCCGEVLEYVLEKYLEEDVIAIYKCNCEY